MYMYNLYIMEIGQVPFMGTCILLPINIPNKIKIIWMGGAAAAGAGDPPQLNACTTGIQVPYSL